jgi:hypothetical protein
MNYNPLIISLNMMFQLHADIQSPEYHLFGNLTSEAVI